MHCHAVLLTDVLHKLRIERQRSSQVLVVLMVLDIVQNTVPSYFASAQAGTRLHSSHVQIC